MASCRSVVSEDPIVSIGISVYPCEDAAVIGFDERQFNRIVIRIAQYFLYKDMRVIFGCDWRENGVMHAILNCAEIAAGASARPPNLTRMINLAPTGDAPVSRAASAAQHETRGTLQVWSVRDYARKLGRDVPRQRPDELRMLRRCVNELLNPGVRICLGGEDWCPTITEEAYFALKMRKPLYLIGGFGGATAAVYDALDGKTSRVLGDLREPLSRFGLEDLSNGLDATDNERLAAATDLEMALGLTWKGVKKLGLVQ